jgi:hypothetical protein
MATLSTITTAYTALLGPGGRFLRYGGIPGAFSGGGLASALWGLDWPASATSLPQLAVLVSLFLFVAAKNGDSWIGKLAGATRT